MLWMGYQSEIVAGQESVAAYVWFYCDLKAHERLSETFAKYSSREDGNNFGVIKDKTSKDSAGDVSWFAQVIREARLLAVSSS